MTYAGHMVKHTLLRCRFSPMATTGQVCTVLFNGGPLAVVTGSALPQRYIYTACARGRVISEFLHLLLPK